MFILRANNFTYVHHNGWLQCIYPHGKQKAALKRKLHYTGTQITQAGYGTIFSLVTHGFHAKAIIRLKAKYQIECSTLLNGTTAEALVLVGCVEFFFVPAFG